MYDDPFASIPVGNVRGRTRKQDDDPFGQVPVGTVKRKPATTTQVPDAEPGFLSRLGSTVSDLYEGAKRDPIGMAKTLGKGIVSDLGDVVEVYRNPAQAAARIAIEEQGDPVKIGARGLNVASYLLPAAGKAFGWGARAVAAGDIGLGAGVGAGLNPDDPLVGATIGGAAAGIGEVTGATRAAVRGGKAAAKKAVQSLSPSMDFGDATKGLAGEITPQFPRTMLRDRIPSMPDADRAEIASVIDKAFAKAEKEAPIATPDVPVKALNARGVRRSTQDIFDESTVKNARQEALAAQLEATPLETLPRPKRNLLMGRLEKGGAASPIEPEATPIRDLGFGEEGTYSAGGTMAGENAPGFVGRRPAQAVEFDAWLEDVKNLTPDGEIPRVTRDRRLALTRPEDAAYRPSTPAGSVDDAMRTMFPEEALPDIVARESMDDVRAAIDGSTVQPGKPKLGTKKAFPDGYSTALKTADVEAVPQPDAPAKVFGQRDGANGRMAASEATKGGGKGAVAPIGPDETEAALDSFLDKLRKAKVNRGKLEMVNQEFAKYMDALRETGDHAVAIEAVEGNAARGFIKRALGQAKTVAPDLSKAVDPELPGVQKVKGGKTVDYRTWTQDQLEAELRAKQDIFEKGMQEFQASAYTRDTGEGYGVGGFADGRGLGWARQAARMMAAAESELRVRLKNAGFTDAEVDARIAQVRTVRNPDRVSPRTYADGELPDEAFVGRNPDVEAPAVVDEVPPDLVPGNAGPGLGTMDEALPPVRSSRTVDAPEVAMPARENLTAEPTVGNAVSDGAPNLRPADSTYLNYRTILEVKDTPLAQATLQRIADKQLENFPEMAAARGYASLTEQEQAAWKSARIREIVDDPLAIDSKKLKNLTGAQVVAVKEVLNENIRMQEVLSREIASGRLEGAELAAAMERMDMLDNSSNEALKTIVGESGRMGRDLGYLRTIARNSTDPAVWMVQAQKRLGDQLMTDQMRDTIVRLANEAKEACG